MIEVPLWQQATLWYPPKVIRTLPNIVGDGIGRCIECDNTYLLKNRRNSAYCSTICGKINNKRRSRKLGRIKIKEQRIESVDPIKVFNRDNWVCKK